MTLVSRPSSTEEDLSSWDAECKSPLSWLCEGGGGESKRYEWQNQVGGGNPKREAGELGSFGDMDSRVISMATSSTVTARVSVLALAEFCSSAEDFVGAVIPAAAGHAG